MDPGLEELLSAEQYSVATAQKGPLMVRPTEAYRVASRALSFVRSHPVRLAKPGNERAGSE